MTKEAKRALLFFIGIATLLIIFENRKCKPCKCNPTERVVIREVPPKDYDQIKQRLSDLTRIMQQDAEAIKEGRPPSPSPRRRRGLTRQEQRSWEKDRYIRDFIERNPEVIRDARGR